MEISEAKKILSLDDNFTQLELVRAYKHNVAENDINNFKSDSSQSFSDYANHLHDIASAFLVLNQSDLETQEVAVTQPLLIFTDASVRETMDVAAFGVVADNIPESFSLPEEILEKYNIIYIPSERGNKQLQFSGLIMNYDVNAAEIMAILCSIEIFMHLSIKTKQKIVIYTDSLVAKKVLTDKRLPSNSKRYTALRDRYQELIDTNQLDIVIKKVNAHVGI